MLAGAFQHGFIVGDQVYTLHLGQKLGIQFGWKIATCFPKALQKAFVFLRQLGLRKVSVELRGKFLGYQEDLRACFCNQRIKLWQPFGWNGAGVLLKQPPQSLQMAVDDAEVEQFTDKRLLVFPFRLA